MQGQTLILNKTFPEFFSEALKKTRSMCKLKRSLVCKQTAHAGTDLDLNKTFPEFFSEALRKTRSMCKLNVLWCASIQHMQGQTLSF